MAPDRRITHGQILELKRLSTPTVYNGWEQLTRRYPARECFNLEETRDFMPEFGAMTGRALTVVCRPSDPAGARDGAEKWPRYLQYVASQPGPKVVLVKDLDGPHCYGAFWGEVTATIHHALGCVGTIMDGAIRDLEEMRGAGFKALARRLAVGHAHAVPLAWGEPVEVFGCRVEPGQLVHADRHGFLAIPPEDESGLLDAAQFMDRKECQTVIAAGREAVGLPKQEALARINEAFKVFRAEVARRATGKSGEF